MLVNVFIHFLIIHFLKLFAVYNDGVLCMDIIQDAWSPCHNVCTILTSIQVSFLSSTPLPLVARLTHAGVEYGMYMVHWSKEESYCSHFLPTQTQRVLQILRLLTYSSMIFRLITGWWLEVCFIYPWKKTLSVNHKTKSGRH